MQLLSTTGETSYLSSTASVSITIQYNSMVRRQFRNMLIHVLDHLDANKQN